MIFNIISWGAYGIGFAIWLYGYLSEGTKSIIDWVATTPAWVSDYLPNLEAEIGMLIMCLGMIPAIYVLISPPADQNQDEGKTS